MISLSKVILLFIQYTALLHDYKYFRDRLNPLDAFNDTEFITRYRVTRVIFIELH